MLYRRVYDIAGTADAAFKVYLNGERVQLKGFQQYIDMYCKALQGQKAAVDTDSADEDDEDENKLVRIYEKVNDRWEIGVCVSDGHFQQVSFVNSINTHRGGSHVTYVADQLVKGLQDHIAKRHKGTSVKPTMVRNHLSIFVNSLIENPAFDSQTKNFLTSKRQNFGSECNITDALMKKVVKSGIVDAIVKFAAFKDTKELKKNDGKKKSRLSGIPKLDDANDAGGRNAQHCTLILTEGDSAKALAVSGLSVVGRDKYGVFPLKGKLLNVREASAKQVLANQEITHLKQILGLQQGANYKDASSLRYGHVMIMTDQDHDGSHIKGLLINLFDTFWPSLLKLPGFLTEFITPIVKCKKGSQELSFYTLPEFESWKSENVNAGGWQVRYYKGLGTSTSAEAKKYFAAILRHQLQFTYTGNSSHKSIDLAFSKTKADARKEWLANFVPGTFLDQSKGSLAYDEFVNKELILFSVASNQRAIPSMVDGLKPGQRKILFCCFLRKLTREIKVAQLSGYVSEKAAYHHGEVSLASTIVGMAQNFTGSNNINLLFPSGQFGTRLAGGKDAASARYIFTFLCPVTRALFHPHDDALLNYQNDDGQSIEPDYYMPVVPMVLVNGSSGIGTGWSSNVPNYNPRDLIDNLQRLLDGRQLQPMQPWFKGFQGTTVPCGNQRFTINGRLEQIDQNTIRVGELPVQFWTNDYKALLESMMAENQIKDYIEHHTDVTVSFTISMTDEQMAAAQKAGLYKHFKLISSIATTNMVLFDSKGQLKRYESPLEILQEFYELRLSYYHKRKDLMTNRMRDELERISNRVRFILAVISDELKIRNVKRAVILEQLVKLRFKAYPKAVKLKVIGGDEADENELTTAMIDDDAPHASGAKAADFDYLLSMPLWSLTLERVEVLKKEKTEKQFELDELLATTPQDLWRRDLKDILRALKLHEDLENQVASGVDPSVVLRKQSKAAVKSETISDDDSPSDAGAHEDSDDWAAAAAKKKTAKGGAGNKLLKAIVHAKYIEPPPPVIVKEKAAPKFNSADSAKKSSLLKQESDSVAESKKVSKKDIEAVILDDEDEIMSDVEQSVEKSESPAPRVMLKRATQLVRKKYAEGDDASELSDKASSSDVEDDDAPDPIEIDDDSGSDFSGAKAKPIKVAKSKPAPKAKPAPVAAKAAPKKKRTIVSDSDDDEPMPQVTQPKAAAKPNKNIDSDSESEQQMSFAERMQQRIILSAEKEQASAAFRSNSSASLNGAAANATKPAAKAKAAPKAAAAAKPKAAAKPAAQAKPAAAKKRAIVSDDDDIASDSPPVKKRKLAPKKKAAVFSDEDSDAASESSDFKPKAKAKAAAVASRPARATKAKAKYTELSSESESSYKADDSDYDD